ncbi:hypothetical protein [Phyllobacterium lublinensis]|uniref:hypothetical protein n=1 Tax=Phyllobacterium lublinensis TaxID=2875708 RepID=UPI001CCEB703|nr:hypothetical protein [Phyllobacterium sp. 2063]MBZ9655334.1 hypothetical protein [Phyllobacterium sp. 2063]
MTVVNRLVVLLPGFEHMPVEAHHRRFVREAAKTAPVYDMQLTETAPLKTSRPDAEVATGEFSLHTSGKDWATQTDFVLYGLGDITMFYASRNPLVRLLSGTGALLDFIVTGTFFRFVAVSWRYSLFFLYPVILLGLVVAASFGAYDVASGLVSGSIIVPLVCALMTAGILCWFAHRKLHLLLLLDDWTFAWDIARGQRPGVLQKLDKVVADAETRIGRTPAGTEIVVAAHSLGAICALQVLDAALRRNAPRRYGLLTVGSSLLKVALHPSARALRESVGTVARSNATWIDVQSLTDPMNFYKSDPVRDLHIQDAKSPVLVRVRFRNQLRDEAYRAIRRNLFRVHRQFVFGVEKRTHYSWHAILCGPESFADIAARGGLPCDRPKPAAPAAIKIQGSAAR